MAKNIKASIGHVGINLSNAGESFKLWKDLALYLGFKISAEEERHFDAGDGKSYICVNVTEDQYKADGFHRKRTGLGHIAFRVSSPEEVDAFVRDFLEPRKIQSLYGGAKEYPQYMPGYYAVYFEDPDRIKIEIVYEPL
ncbi:MAG: VOC family protein [Alphaproteobacteria bacterium]|nr:VOC family protein [Alphaproteobacteria bacterium]